MSAMPGRGRRDDAAFCTHCGSQLQLRCHRSGALSLVDSIILVFVLLALQAVFVDGAFSNSEDEAASNVVSTINFVINVVYFGTLVAISQATLGKRVFGLYIVRPDGSRVGFGLAVARYFATLLSAAIMLIGFIMIGLRRDKRGLHDLICDTVVLRR